MPTKKDVLFTKFIFQKYDYGRPMSEEIPTNVKVIKGTFTKKRHEMQRENSDGIDGVLKFNVGNSSMYEIRTQLSFQKDCESAFICKQTFMLVAKTLWPFI